jgi:hypothetical protein
MRKENERFDLFVGESARCTDFDYTGRLKGYCAVGKNKLFYFYFIHLDRLNRMCIHEIKIKSLFFPSAQ